MSKYTKCCDNCNFQDLDSAYWKCDDTREHRQQNQIVCENWKARADGKYGWHSKPVVERKI